MVEVCDSHARELRRLGSMRARFIRYVPLAAAAFMVTITALGLTQPPPIVLVALVLLTSGAALQVLTLSVCLALCPRCERRFFWAVEALPVNPWRAVRVTLFEPQPECASCGLFLAGRPGANS